MKTIVYMCLLSLLFSCNNTQDMEIFSMEGMDGKSEYIHFVSPEEGYSFNNRQHSEKQTEEQINDPYYNPPSTDEAIIYKTIDGGKNWKNVSNIDGYSFYNAAFSNNDNIFIKIIDSEEILNNKLLKYDLKTQQRAILNFNFERMGETWGIDKKVFINSKNKGISSIYSTDLKFTKIDSVRESNVFKDKIILLDKNPFVLTWNNEVYDIAKNETKKLDNIELMVATKGNEKTLLIGGNLKSDDQSVGIISYDVQTAKEEKLIEFKGYSIVQGLQSNEKVICGFIGNIEGMFTSYDLFYSLDQGKTFKIQKLKEASYIRPSSLINNILYIYSGRNRMQKITFK